MHQFVKNLVGRKRFLSAVQNELTHHRWRWIGMSSCRFQEIGAAESTSEGFLREAYHCNEAWNKRLEMPLLKKINLDDFFYDIDKRYQMDKVISAIDVDLYVNKATPEENAEEIEELIHRLRRSPATVDALPSTSHALIKSFLKAGKIEEIFRIVNDRWNYGIFVDFHTANILMDEFLKQGNFRDAAKVASLLMLEEDFGPPTSQYFSLLSCLMYAYNPTPEPWDTSPPKEEPEEEVKGRLHSIRNPYFDDHFDLVDANHVVGKTLALVSREATNDDVLSRSAQLLGWAMYGKWDKVELLLKESLLTKKAFAEQILQKVTEICDKAMSDIEASPNKTLTKPKVHQYPGVNLDEKDVTEMWKTLNYPDFEKNVSQVQSIISSNQVGIAKGFNMIEKSQQLLSITLAEREDKEIQEQLKNFENWNKRRELELDNQLKRFRKFDVLENVAAKKKDLKEKEEVIFFFDNEEEWMMRLPPDEQKGYKLSTEYIASNWTRFVKTIPPKRNKIKKKKL